MLRMGCSYGAMLSGSLASFFSHFLFLCISIGLIATTLYNNISLFSSVIGCALHTLRDVDSRGTGIRGSNHSSLPTPLLRAFPNSLVQSRGVQYHNDLTLADLGPPWGFRTRRIPSPLITLPPLRPKVNSTRPSESVGGCLCSDRVISSALRVRKLYGLRSCASRRFLHTRYPNAKWGNPHHAPFRGAATPNPRYLPSPKRL